MLALACMGKAADMGRSSASTSEIFLDGGRLVPVTNILALLMQFKIMESTGTGIIVIQSNPNKLWGELGVLAGQEGLVSNFLIIVI